MKKTGKEWSRNKELFSFLLLNEKRKAIKNASVVLGYIKQLPRGERRPVLLSRRPQMPDNISDHTKMTT